MACRNSSLIATLLEKKMDILDINTVKKLLSGHDNCLIGVSGGVDSMVLLHWFARNRDHFPCSIRAMHVDHGINQRSEDWASYVESTCKDIGIACEIKKVSLDGLGSNLEYAARQARYRAFCQSGASALILAHHANDQCESFLLKLFRGSGVKGLKAMPSSTACWYDPNVAVIRPMLAVNRSHIESWAEANGIGYVEDPSNADVRYDRNYIRNRIWPVIKERFDIADINMTRSIQHLGEAWELNNVLAEIDLNTVTLRDGELDWQKTKSLGYLRIKNMLLHILDKQNIYGFSIGHIEQFANGLIDASMDSKNELSLKGFSMNKVGRRIYINGHSPKERAA